MPWVFMSVVWASSCTAIGYAVFVTKSASCLWALLIPACIGFTSKSSDCKCKGDE